MLSVGPTQWIKAKKKPKKNGTHTINDKMSSKWERRREKKKKKWWKQQKF